VLAVLGIAALLVAIPLRFPASRRLLTPGVILVVLGLLVVLKSPSVAQQTSAWLRLAGGQSALLAAAGDLPWWDTLTWHFA